MATQLQDGQALTVEWLNSLVQEINDLRKSVDTGDARRKIVAWTGNKIPSTTTVIEVESGLQNKIKIEKGKPTTATINFQSPFASPTAINVICNVDSNTIKNAIPVMVTNITSKNFTVVIGNSDNVSGTVNLRYIAIGQSK